MKRTLLVIMAALAAGCGTKPGSQSPQGGEATATPPAHSAKKKQFLSIGTAPPGGAFLPVGNAIASVLNANRGANNWDITAEATKGSRENIRRLARGELTIALANAAITYFAVRGESGWNKKYEMRSVMTLAPNVAQFITKSSSGVKKIADLKGKRVVVGPAGAGFEMFVKPILEAHGVRYDDFTPLNATQTGAVDLLADGSAAAAFLGGAVPTGSITQACSSMDIVFLPYEEEAKKKLMAKYRFYYPVTIPASKYTDLKADYAGMNVGNMILITSANEDEDLIYEMTKIIFEHGEDVARQHPAGKAIKARNVVRDTGTPFHPGAIRYYKEKGIWPTPPK